MDTNRSNIKKRINSKIRSERGASITFALLLFLICAVLSAVMLVAGTTVSGRIKGLAQTDQRYYSVTSAAELFKDKLDDKAVSRLTYPEDDGAVYTFDCEMNEVTSTLISNNTTTPSGTTSFAKYIAGIYFGGISGDSTTETLKLTTAESDDLTVNIAATVYSNGDVDLVLSDSDNKYSVLMKFSADINITDPPLEKGSFSDPYEIRWHLSKMISSYDNSRQNQ